MPDYATQIMDLSMNRSRICDVLHRPWMDSNSRVCLKTYLYGASTGRGHLDIWSTAYGWIRIPCGTAFVEWPCQ